MDIIKSNFKFPKNVSLILGFFDGIHLGHQSVINDTSNNEKVLVTFSKSPAEYFNKKAVQIYSREYNYQLLDKLGIKYIYERNFSDVVEMTADEYINDLIEKFSPKSITTGINHTFGYNREGNSDFLRKKEHEFKYHCTPLMKIDGDIVSSTKIKELLHSGKIETANQFLTRNFSLESKVIEGVQLGRKLGFPTANMKYPFNTIKIPYGVYKIKALNKPAIMNWGIKPTIISEELLEIHIPNFNANLYNKNLKIEIISKIRDEKKFESLEELKNQIKEDIKECLG